MKSLLAHHIPGLLHKNYTRFIVLTRSRTGSNMLISCLNSHPAIHAESEIFARLNGRSNEEILDSVFCRQGRSIKAVGFKIFYYHPLDDEQKQIWQTLRIMEGLHVIHLKRRNILRTLVSRKIAGRRDVWSSLDEEGTGGAADKQVEFTPAELLEGFNQTRCWETSYDSLFSGTSKLNVFYEDLVKGLNEQYRKVTDFLQLAFHPPRTRFERQNPEPLRALIRNYDELQHEFRQTEWSDFFDEA
jgi:LPS sulfotransferase NodH